MMQARFTPSFAGWQRAARERLQTGCHWRDVLWQEAAADEPMLDFGEAAEAGPANAQTEIRVPRAFQESAERVACHRSSGRWAMMYRMLWRLTHGEKHLLQVPTDPDTVQWQAMDKAVRHAVHKMRAFVRFRAVQRADVTWYVAWFEPEHAVVELNARFFVDRFAGMSWSILTPERCMHWDRTQLTFSEGVTRAAAPKEDEVENLWLTYYGHIFNPARVKVPAMLAEMPKHYWRNLPETAIIPHLLQDAPRRVAEMVARSREAAALSPAPLPAVMAGERAWEELRTALERCRACPLHAQATQAVPGTGPRNARVMLLGEQPGDLEDLEGRPFVGPAGQLLDRALEEAGLRRADLYVTNAVKHFKWEMRGKRRLHVRASSSEIGACKPWWQKEAQLVKPDVLVCLGATAAGAVMGRTVKIADERGELCKTQWAPRTLITTHPSALLRMGDAQAQARALEAFVSDLRLAKAAADGY
jgi:DNA polymerase